MKTWTDADELDRIQNRALAISNDCSRIVYSVNAIERGLKIPNIGTFYNNKMVEIHNFFKSKKVPYSHSSVNRSIDAYFTILIEEATKNLEKYTTANLGRLKLYGRVFFKKKFGKKYLDEYIRISNLIREFSIEKDVEDAINMHLNDYLERSIKGGWYDGNINGDILLINNELDMLGIKTEIDYRDIEYDGQYDKYLVDLYSAFDKVGDLLEEYQNENREFLEDVKNFYGKNIR